MRRARLSDITKPVLAIDSALGGCVTAVLDPASGATWVRVLETGREQAAKLMPMVQAVVADAGMNFKSIGLIATTIGPGSFTGLRIGLSAARSLGLALSIPVQGVDSFTAMARSCARDGDAYGYAVVLETKRADFYMRYLGADFLPLSEPACGSAAEIMKQVRGKKLILCGDATGRLIAEMGENPFTDIRDRILPDPVALAKVGLEAFIRSGGRSEKPEPLYLRGADVSASNKKQRILNNYPE